MLRKRPRYDPRIKYAVQLREPPRATVKEINESFLCDERINMIHSSRMELDQDEDGYIKVCQGPNYCEHYLVTNRCVEEFQSRACDFCVRISPHDIRYTETILKEIVRKRTKGRH